MGPITDLKNLPFVAVDTEHYLDGWYEVEDARQTIAPEDWERIEDFFDREMERQLAAWELAQEIAGWILPGMVPGFTAVWTDWEEYVAIYVREDMTYGTKSIDAFNADPFTPPATFVDIPALPLLRVAN